MRWQAVLFDLDGTLVDTAPDLAGAVQELARERGLAIPPFPVLRAVASHGAPGLLGSAFGLHPQDAEYAAMRADFLRLYRSRAHRDSSLFPGIDDTLARLRQQDIPWGIVTNKTEELACDLLAVLALPYPPQVLVGGDTAGAPKPSPLPVQYALQHLGVSARQALLLGDDRRDIEAAHTAGCTAWAAAWGYWQESDPVDTWGADVVLRDSQELRSHLLTS